jgi:hypothetical protein
MLDCNALVAVAFFVGLLCGMSFVVHRYERGKWRGRKR